MELLTDVGWLHAVISFLIYVFFRPVRRTVDYLFLRMIGWPSKKARKRATKRAEKTSTPASMLLGLTKRNK